MPGALALCAVSPILRSGLEIAKPPDQEHSTTRINMFTEFAGQYVKLGVDGKDENTRPTHLFVDGIIDKECPFLFNAGTYTGMYTKVSTLNPNVVNNHGTTCHACRPVQEYFCVPIFCIKIVQEQHAFREHLCVKISIPKKLVCPCVFDF